ncbi:hypothetical protein BH23ACI1_BH23ACI1_07030 [soil metagenome]
MVIKASASADIRQLITALSSDDEVARETAVARLAIIGSRAVDRLLAAYRGTTDRGTRTAILRALEPSADDRALAIAREALRAGGDMGVAASGVLRSLLDSRQAPTAAAALDALITVVTDGATEHRLRFAAGEALRAVPAISVQVAAALRELPGMPDQAPEGDAARAGAEAGAVWQDALEGRLPDLPGSLREALNTYSSHAPLGGLQGLVEAVRAHEQTVGADRRSDWRTLRGALHQALALRGSRVALYDLRESLEQAAEPLPPAFLAALHAVGDESCLEPIAAAHHVAQDARWKAQLREAFQAIARRERLTRRSAVIKRVAARWGEDFKELSGARRGRARRSAARD